MAKDILAMSNIQDGGVLLIGIEDNTFVRQGVSEAQRITFDFDTMRDQMARYADPHVDFRVSYPTDEGGLRFVAIEVSQFAEVPVICRSDGPDLRAGVVYYRNRNRRWESAPISNSFDMRELLDLAAALRMQKLQRVGLVAQAPADVRFDEELEGL